MITWKTIRPTAGTAGFAPAGLCNSFTRGARHILVAGMCLAGIDMDCAAMPLPPAAGVVDVTLPPYLADKTGKTDCTAALNRAMQDAARKTPGIFTTTDRAVQIVYLPAGIYRVSGPLVFATDEILKARPQGQITDRNYIQGHMMLIGETRDSVRIQVTDQSPAFAQGRVAVIRMTSKKGTNQDYFNWVMDVTIDTGRRNPAAVGLDFVSSNIGGVRDVKFVCPDAGNPSAAGLDLTVRSGGLGYVHRIEVEGFREGVRVGGNFPGFVLEDIRLRGQTEAGIVNEDKNLAIRSLHSDNRVPAIVAQGAGCITTLLDSECSGGDRTNSAIVNQGHLYARNIRTSGYLNALTDHGKMIGQSALTEYVTGGVTKLFSDTPDQAPGLELRDVPDHPWPRPDQWTVFDSQAQDDDTQALQALIDAGAEQIFIKADKGRLKLTGTIHLRGRLKRLHGGWGNMIVENQGPAGQPLFRFETGEADFVILEAFSNGQRRHTFTTFVDASEKPIVLRDLMMGYGVANYRNTGTGDLFVENVVTGGGDFPETGETVGAGWLLKNQRAWVRNWNPEDWTPDLRIEGGEVIALGGKFGEIWGTYLEVCNGARAELFGFMLNSNPKEKNWFPERMTGVAVEVQDADLALTAFEDGQHQAPTPILIRETRAGQVRELKHSEATLRQSSGKKDESVVVSLYRSVPAGK